ncbi:hypothetical protein HANVADRAFT_53895 [Hanseniaspora valbyensis NRRL Y-1626]|uniref:Sporulation-specific protein 4 n=1 Tax=Hanseniaspora valbyensis NRRL Y-1626 TaxID=766949 RepID=A0A1B7T9V6_9ASCO|nr:hypothetical protein HANVADRAFT_53895 [Hanseniaspora valbyensis NRRL Y-1626]
MSAVENTTTTVAPESGSEHLKFKVIDHLYTYPLVQQTDAFVSTLPVTRVVVANVKPLLETKIVTAPLKVMKPATDLVDNLAVKSLVALEKVIPSLKTKTYQRLGEEAMMPYNFTKNTINKGASEVIDFTVTYGYEPVHSNIVKFRKLYNEKVYDTKGKPLIRGSLDSVFAPCNKKLEEFIKQYLPEGTDVPTEGFTNEFDRSFALAYNALTRAIPVTEKKATDVIMAPCNYSNHVVDVFNSNLDKEENLGLKNSLAASKAAVIELEQEALTFIKEKNPIAKKSTPQATAA